MAVEQIDLELINDNPYQARATYHRKDIDDLAHSIKTHGLLQVPPGRRKDGNVELGFGHLRKRAFAKLAKKDPKKWSKMPVDIRELSDEQMALFALEENLKRRDLSSLETARAVDHYLNSFLEKTEVEVAEYLNMTKANVSNMRRVLRLPEKILAKIDEGRINFTQGRELIILEKLENSEDLMQTAIRSIKSEARPYGHPNTVEGMQQAVHGVVGDHCRPLDKQWEGYRWDILFDTRAGCLECDKMIRTHPTKSATAHYCTDAECWQAKQEEHRGKAAAAAKAKMEAEVLSRAAQVIEEEKAPVPEPAAAYKMENRGTSWIAIDDQGRIIAINHDKKAAEEIAKASFKPVATIGDPCADEYRLNHTYRFVEKPGSRKLEVFDVTAQDLATAAEALGVDRENIELVKVWKSSGKLGTAGSVSAGWSKCTEPLEEQLEGQVDERDRLMEETRERANLERPVGETPCDTCDKGESCDRTFFHVADDDSGRLVCEQWECDHVSWALPKEPAQAVPKDLLEREISQRIAEAPAPAPQEIPEDILTLAREKAGTRAEVIDIREVKSGYTILKGWAYDELRYMDDPTECTEKCTRGFHFGFDSRDDKGTVYFICTDTKCLAKKKAAFTRNKNAEGQARKKAEVKAVKEAIDLVGQVTTDGKQLLDEEGKFANTLVVPRATLKLILLAQMKGKHTTRSYYGGDKMKHPEKWLWDKISAGTPENDRTTAKLFKAIDKLSDEELARLVVEFMFYFLQDHGDIGTYELQVEEPLGWMGITIEQEAREIKSE